MSKTPSLILCAMLLAGLFTGCSKIPYTRSAKPSEPLKHLAVSAKETVELSDREFLMRKATLGTRSERLEALDVIERSGDQDMVEFLLDRLKKEDDRFLQIKIMYALAALGDVRAVAPIRAIARWDDTRVGIEAVAALYELGDDQFIPRLINRMRKDSQSPELAGIAHRTLKKMTGENLPQSVRVWTNWYLSHRLAPYQTVAWYWPFRQPVPPTIEGTTKVVRGPKGKIPLPKEDVRLRRTHITWQDWWKTAE
jgi:hypothetical protein